MKKFFFLAVLSGILSAAEAQQAPMYTQYMFNTLAVNPAYAGSRNVLSMTGLARKQWIGIEGAPQTETISMDAATPNKRVGLGLQVFSDKVGITQTTGAYASYAYRLLFEKSTLAFGLQAGVAQYHANFTTVQLGTGSASDPAFSSNLNQIVPNVGFGVYYNTSRFYIGASAPNILNNRLINSASTNVSTGLVSREELHLFLSSGYVFDLGEYFKLKPSFLLKEVAGAPVQADINLNLWLKDKIGFGAQYRSGDAFAALLEVQLSDHFRLGYSYDWTVSKLATYNSGSHEIMLRYEFFKEKGGMISPRYF